MLYWWIFLWVDEGVVLGYLVESYDVENDVITEGYFIGESLRIYDESALCFSCGFFDVTKYSMYVGWILGVLLVFTDGPVLGSDLGLLLGHIDEEVLGSACGVPYGFIVGIYEGSGMGSLVG